MPVLWEASSELTAAGWKIEGLSGNYIRVTTIAPEPRWNQVDNVRLTGLDGDGMAGELL